MIIQHADFVISSTDYKKCPKPDKPEYAFIGRSNVGKSSLINKLTQRPGLAKTSQRPGKTQLINHFLIDAHWYLVDLPGYGWARAPKNEREKWDKMIREYLLYRENLQCVFVLIDSRHEPQKVDLNFMQWLAESGIPFVMVFTKADKQTKGRTQDAVLQYIHTMQEQWEEIPQYFVTSSVSGEGREEIMAFIKDLNKKFEPVK
jgi:GTP-binding protein